MCQCAKKRLIFGISYSWLFSFISTLAAVFPVLRILPVCLFFLFAVLLEFICT